MKPRPPLDSDALRQAAESHLREKGAARSAQNEADLRKLQHELQVHQIELEMQNDELRAAHAVIAADLEQYSDHFDFAPVGYFNLTADGTIKLVNLAGAKLVGIERARLQDRRFMLMVAENDRRTFTDFLARVFETKTRNTCELALSSAGRPDLFVRLEAAISPDGTECRAAIVDITEIKQAEEAARRAARFAQSTIDALTAHLCVLDRNGIILTTNKAWNRFADANPPINQRVNLGTNYLDVCQVATGAEATDALAFATGIRDVIRGARDVFSMEYPCHSPGEQRWFLGHVTRFQDDAEERVVVFHENITERKRAEESKRHSGECLAGIVNSAMDGIISIDSQQRILLFNAAAEQMFGYRASQVICKTLDFLLPGHLRAAHVQDIDDFANSNVIPRKMNVLGALTGLRANGDEFPIEASISQVEVAGETLCTVILRDITQRARAEAELRESEARYRSLFNNMLNGFALCEMIFDQGHPADYLYLAANTAFETLTGLKNVVGRKISDVLPGIFDADPTLFEIFGRVVQTGLPERFETYVQTMDMWFWISAYRTAPGQFAVVFDVITERKLAEQNLRRSEEQMRALAARLQIIREEERMQIAREIHDVLAQELTLLKFNVVWASRRLAKAVDESTGAAVVEKLLTITEQTESAIHTVQKIATDLRPVVLDRLGLFAAIEWQAADFEKRTGIACHAKVPAEAPLVGRDHATAVFRILQESLTNVVRHAHATQAAVEIAVENGNVIMTVRDNGIGISVEKLSDMHSIGLVGMRERALVFGGCVDIAGTPDAGTTVTVRMPLSRPSEVS